MIFAPTVFNLISYEEAYEIEAYKKISWMWVPETSNFKTRGVIDKQAKCVSAKL